MQAKRFLLVVGVAGLVVAATWAGMHLWSGSVALASADSQQRWEYKVVYNNCRQVSRPDFSIYGPGTYNDFDSDPQGALNSVGATGWELVGVTVESSVHTYFFKRPLP